jgi:hypothetical protein
MGTREIERKEQVGGVGKWDRDEGGEKVKGRRGREEMEM